MVFRILLIVFIVVPALEIWGLITIGKLIGGWLTFALLLLIGFFGAYLAKREGKKVWQYAQHQLSLGQVPTGSILDGICIFAGGLLMMVPGFITDILGFFLVFPLTRPLAKGAILYLIQKQISNGSSFFIFRR